VGIERLAQRIELLRVQALRVLERGLGDVGGGGQAGAKELRQIRLLLHHLGSPHFQRTVESHSAIERA
jgi:hypothetical protein